MLSITFITGPAGSSKSTLAKRVSLLARDPYIFSVDSSHWLRICREHKSPFGLKLKALEADQEKGFLMPGELVVGSFFEYLGWLIHRAIVVGHLIIAGCPRTVDEIEAWDKAVRQKLVSYKVALIECTELEIKQGVQNRINKGELRADQGSEETRTRIEEYNTKTHPMATSLPKRLLIQTARHKPFEQRMRDLIHGMDVEDWIKQKWIRRLDTPSHPIHASIREIDPDHKPVALTFATKKERHSTPPARMTYCAPRQVCA